MKKAVIISFDIIREGDPQDSLAIGYLTAKLKSLPEYGTEFVVEKKSVNISKQPFNEQSDFFRSVLSPAEVQSYDTIALSAYVWNDNLLNPFIAELRKSGYANKIVLGGYQISFGDPAKLSTLYPGCDIFIPGYAENSLASAIQMGRPLKPIVLFEESHFSNAPSPFLNNEIAVHENQPMVRMMTKRGCAYNCRYCAHRDLIGRKVQPGNLEIVSAELDLFRRKGVRRVNIIDPVFNFGDTYLPILEYIRKLRFQETEFTLQTRIERIRGKEGERFLELVRDTGAHLEIGIQTVQPKECNAVGRPANKAFIASTLRELNRREISYEVSIIYGLPEQSYASFRDTVDFIKNAGCTRAHAYPLMLLRGTELWKNKELWKLREEPEGEYGIPAVIESASFTRAERKKMREYAETVL